MKIIFDLEKQAESRCADCIEYSNKIRSFTIRKRDKFCKELQKYKNEQRSLYQNELNNHLFQFSHAIKNSDEIIYNLQTLQDNTYDIELDLKIDDPNHDLYQFQHSSVLLTELNNCVQMLNGSLIHRLDYLKNMKLIWYPVISHQVHIEKLHQEEDEKKLIQEFLKDEQDDIEMKELCNIEPIDVELNLENLVKNGINFIDLEWIPSQGDVIILNWKTRNDPSWFFTMFIFDSINQTYNNYWYGYLPDQKMKHRHGDHRIDLNNWLFLHPAPSDQSSKVKQKLFFPNSQISAIKDDQVNKCGIFGFIFHLNLQEHVIHNQRIFFKIPQNIIQLLQQKLGENNVFKFGIE